MKLCPRCLVHKESALYGRDPSKRDGLSHACKTCTAAYLRAYKDRRLAERGPIVRPKNGRDVARHRATARAYKRRNVAKINALVTKRRAVLLRAMPSWANEFFIEQAYDIAKIRGEITGVEHHVDHIVPLISDLVCGLHVEHNLQVIPAVANLRKSNSFRVE